jgi:uncharacterized membrane protein YsdA (DUF1294 family)
MNILFNYFLIVNVIAFVIPAYDKYLAKKIKRRVFQRNAWFVFIGGTIGSGLAMLTYRHKTVKGSYLWKFWESLLYRY